ncbi:MAG: tetratricopeptide repeat protein [Nitrososphaerales archaeon]
MALLSIYTRRPKDALSYQKRALELDPQSRLVNMGMAIAQLSLGENAQAKARLDRLSAEYPESATIKFWKAHAHLCLKESHSAIEEAKEALTLESSSFMRLSLAWMYAETGRHSQARELLQEVEHGTRDDYLRPSEIGAAMLALGETKEGFKWWEKAAVEKDTGLLMMGGLPWYRKYTALPGWKKIDAKIGIPKQ